MCQVLGVSPSGYYAWLRRSPSQRLQRDAELLERIKLIHSRSRGIYGAPRIYAELRRQHQTCCSRKRVARLRTRPARAGLCPFECVKLV